MKILAKLISRVFDPIIEIPLMLVLASWYAYVNGMRWQFLLLLLFIDAILPFAFFLYLLRKHEVEDWDITKRAQRIPVYGLTMLAHLAGVGMSYFAGQVVETQILFVFWLLGMLFFGITMFWKISVHAGVYAALVTFLVLSMDRSLLWMYLLLIPIGWSRVVLGKHTPIQFVAGTIIASLGMWIGFSWFGLV